MGRENNQLEKCVVLGSLKGARGKNTAHFCLIVCLKRSKTYAFLIKQFVSELVLTLQHSD